ncbi:protein phosphatase 2C family protein isoform X2 [Carex rostrata]
MASMVLRHLMKVGGLVWKRKKHGENEMEKSRRGVRISYGFYCVENQDGCEGSVVAQKVETDSISMRLFGVFDQQMEGLTSTGHLQSLLLSSTKNLNESKIRRSTKKAIKNAYKKSKAKQGNKNGGFATLLLSSNRKIVVATSGGFEIILCNGGTATPVGTLKSVSDLIPMPCIVHKEADKEPKEKLMITTRNLEPDTSFIILASNGIWEVLGYQEAVHLLGHIEDAQKAAECLAEEAITRLSKSNISCLIIRF